MTHNSQRRIRNLLNKDLLTGFEVAKITMSALYELMKISDPELYGLKGVGTSVKIRNMPLTEVELKELQSNNLKGHDDRIEEYNDWIGAFPHIIHLVDYAHLMYLNSVNILLSLTSVFLIEGYLKEPLIKSTENSISKPCYPANQTLKNFLTYQIQRVKTSVSLFLFSKTILNIFTEKTGIGFNEQLDFWYERIKSSIDIYSKALNDSLIISAREKKDLDGVLDPIGLDDIQINKEIEQKFRERLCLPLERDIWEIECKKLFYEDLEARKIKFTV
jgi:hypothetical protein